MFYIRRGVLISMLLMGSALASVAQSPVAPPTNLQATTVTATSAQNEPNDANGWEKLGLANLQSGKYQDAVTAFRTALDKGFPQQTGKYNLACAYARAGENDKALDLLQSLVAAGYPAPIANDPDLASLAGEPRFQQMLAAARRVSEPCKDAKANPEYRQLDFWVGDWDVYSGNTKVGESSVQLILKDCVVFENWQGLQGGAGKSFNKFDPVSKHWEQFWVSDSGTTNYFKGVLVDGEMRYVLEIPNASGGTLTRHLTFSKLPNGGVRQLSQRSTDGGKTWMTEYDLTYLKKNQSPTSPGS